MCNGRRFVNFNDLEISDHECCLDILCRTAHLTAHFSVYDEEHMQAGRFEEIGTKGQVLSLLPGETNIHSCS